MLEQTVEHSVVPDFAIALRGYDKTQVDGYIERLVQWVNDERAQVEQARRNVTRAYREAEALRERYESAPPPRSPATEPPPAAFAAVAVEASAILTKAGEAAEELLAQARNQATQVVKDAEAQMVTLKDEAAKDRAEAATALGRVREDAEATAAEIRRRAEASATTTVKEAEDKAASLRSEGELAVQAGKEWAAEIMQEAERRRDEVTGEITRLQGQRHAIVDELDRLRALLENVTTHLRAGAVPAVAAEPESAGDLSDYDNAFIQEIDLTEEPVQPPLD